MGGKTFTTKYPYAPNRKRQGIKHEVHHADNPHDWIVRRPFWVCRACDIKVDGSIVGSRYALFDECPCAPEGPVVPS